MLAARQRGFVAGQRIAAKSPPVKVDTLALFESENSPRLMRAFAWAGQTVEAVMFSPSGQHLAVVTKHAQYEVGHEQSDSESDVSEDFDSSATLHTIEFHSHQMCTYQVIVYEASEGFKQCERFVSLARTPVIQWSPTSCLCVAQLLTKGNLLSYAQDSVWINDMSIWNAAFIYSPGLSYNSFNYDGACLGSGASLRLSDLGKRCKVHSCWSPSGRYLLVHGTELPRRSKTGRSGWLGIADVEGDSLVAYSKLMPVIKPCAQGCLSFIWHPSSRGIISSGDMKLQDMAAIARAGFSFGTLPVDLSPHQAGFSANAEYLLADSHGPYDDPDQGNFRLFECKVEHQELCLVQVRDLAAEQDNEALRLIGWLPDTNVFCIQRVPYEGTIQTLLTECTSRQEPVFAAASQAFNPFSHRLSASGRLYTACNPEDDAHSIIAELVTGEHFWEMCTSDLTWPGLTAHQSRSLQALCPSLCCHGWAPVGVGPVCSTHGTGHPKSRGFLPPALHFYSYV